LHAEAQCKALSSTSQKYLGKVFRTMSLTASKPRV
jgi:hypothetical protein